MPKWKQATLFSLKSWNKVTVEDIRRSKAILDCPGQAEIVIINCLLHLKNLKPPKDTVLSCGLDVSLRKLRNHPSSTVANKATSLMEYLNLKLCTEDYSKSKQNNEIPSIPKEVIKKSVNEVKVLTLPKTEDIKKESIINTNRTNNKLHRQWLNALEQFICIIGEQEVQFYLNNIVKI